MPHSYAGWPETLWGFHPMGIQLWNSMRALDFLQSLPDVDPHRIAATGASGGATQTFLLAAVDDRVGYASPVNMVSAYMQGGDPCEEAPNLRLDTFNVEIAAMIAPRPLLVVSSTRDWTRHTPVEEFPAIRRIYELYGAAQHVQNVHIAAEHNYNRQSREAVYQFLAKAVQPELEGANLVDQPVVPPADEELLALPRTDLPPEFATSAEVFTNWKAAARLQTQNFADNQELREAIRYALGAEWPAECESVLRGNRLGLSRAGRGDRVAGTWIEGTGAPVLVVHPGGSAAALRSGRVSQLVKSGRPVLVIEPFRSNAVRSQKQRVDESFFSYNRSDAAEQVQDILTALAYLKTKDRGKPTLLGMESAGVWCVFAGAVAPIEIDIVADLNGFGGSDRDFHERFFVPGIQRAGGLSAALKLTNSVRTVIESQ